MRVKAFCLRPRKGAMTTEKQTAANRRKCSIVDRAGDDGRERALSRWNALKHGLRAETVVLPDENPADYLDFRHALVDELQPAGGLEAIVVDRIMAPKGGRRARDRPRGGGRPLRQ